jgi:hypothetical protein
VRACVCVLQLCVCARAFVRVRDIVWVPSGSIFAHVLRVRACACVRACVCVWSDCVGAVEARRGPAILIARPAAAARARSRSGATGFRCRARSAAGRTFSNRTLQAEWAARYLHTSVVDAAGAIYVIGGVDEVGVIFYNDVWVSTDGGARAGLGRGAVGGYTKVLQGYYGGTRVLQGVLGLLRGVLRGY